jgi:transketolase
MVNKIPCRKAFTDAILEAAKKDKHIFVVTTDARGSVTLDGFARELPEQFVEVGIAEQNSVGIAAGLALAGNNVFVCGPACFYSSRSLEQVKVDVAYSNTNVKVIGVSGGVSYGALGSTHHSLHDIAVMRTFPGLEVYLPADRFQTVKLTEYLTGSDNPAYVRIGRGAVPDVYTENDRLVPGKANILEEGNDLSIIACGETVYHALEAAKELAKTGIKARVIDMHTLKPIDKAAVIAAAKETGHIITVEEHSVYGGLGAIVAEITAQECPVKMKILGIPDVNVVSATPVELFAHYGLDKTNIVREAKAMLKL